MTPTLSRSETWSLLSLSTIALAVIAQTFQGDGAPVVASLAFSALAYTTTFALIRWLGPAFIRAGLKGRDMSKKQKPEMCVSYDCTIPNGEVAAPLTRKDRD